MFLRIGRSRRPQTEVLREVKSIFRYSIQGLPPALALAERQSFGPGSVRGIPRPDRMNSPAPASRSHASQNRVCPLSSTTIAAITSMPSPRTYVLAALYLLEDS